MIGVGATGRTRVFSTGLGKISSRCTAGGDIGGMSLSCLLFSPPSTEGGTLAGDERWRSEWARTYEGRESGLSPIRRTDGHRPDNEVPPAAGDRVPSSDRSSVLGALFSPPRRQVYRPPVTHRLSDPSAPGGRKPAARHDVWSSWYRCLHRGCHAGSNVRHLLRQSFRSFPPSPFSTAKWSRGPVRVPRSDLSGCAWSRRTFCNRVGLDGHLDRLH